MRLSTLKTCFGGTNLVVGVSQKHTCIQTRPWRNEQSVDLFNRNFEREIRMHKRSVGSRPVNCHAVVQRVSQNVVNSIFRQRLPTILIILAEDSPIKIAGAFMDHQLGTNSPANGEEYREWNHGVTKESFAFSHGRPERQIYQQLPKWEPHRQSIESLVTSR